jgi:hypothetical protein
MRKRHDARSTYDVKIKQEDSHAVEIVDSRHSEKTPVLMKESVSGLHKFAEASDRIQFSINAIRCRHG